MSDKRGKGRPSKKELQLTKKDQAEIDFRIQRLSLKCLDWAEKYMEDNTGAPEVKAKIYMATLNKIRADKKPVEVDPENEPIKASITVHVKND